MFKSFQNITCLLKYSNHGFLETIITMCQIFNLVIKIFALKNVFQFLSC